VQRREGALAPGQNPDAGVHRKLMDLTLKRESAT